MRATDGLQATITVSPVNSDGQAFSLESTLEICLPIPQQDEHLPDQIESYVHQAGLETQRRLFQVLMEKADQELVLQQRHGKGGAGIQRRGTRPFTFKTIFGEVAVERLRISHNQDGTIEIPSATAWNTSHQLHITQNLRDAVCDQMSDQSAGKSRTDVCQYAGDGSLLGRSTIIDIVHQEGEQLSVAQRQRAQAILDGASEAQLALLGTATDDAMTELVDDDLPLDDSEEAEAEWEQTVAEWIATGFPGCEPAFPVAKDEPRAVDEGFVIVEPDEVKTKAQPSTGRKEVWTYTAVVLVAGLRYAFAEATVEGLWLQVAALLVELGVLKGERRLLVLGDGAAWIRAWFESLGISLKTMILCWWHLRKRCYEQMSSAGGPKDRRRAFEKQLLGQLWEGKVNAAASGRVGDHGDDPVLLPAHAPARDEAARGAGCTRVGRLSDQRGEQPQRAGGSGSASRPLADRAGPRRAGPARAGVGREGGAAQRPRTGAQMLASRTAIAPLPPR